MNRVRLPPGSWIGILGGGQLGRMLAMAAAQLGLRCHIYCPDRASPAFDVAARHTVAAYDDPDALESFAQQCDVVTCEFENVPAATLVQLARRVAVRPSANSFAICQDRMAEKHLLDELGIATADWRPIHSAADLEAAAARIGPRAILKSARLGYDGKGQARVNDPSRALTAWDAIGRAPAILEALVPFSREISVIGIRDDNGNFVSYDVTENFHEAGILRTSRVPARAAIATQTAARDIARRVGDALDHIGAFAIEMFVIGDGPVERLLVNEIAPRVHNTGHWTIEACTASQFDAHIRAVAGWPLPDTSRIADARMCNLIGDEAEEWGRIAAEPGAAVHLYGKHDSRPGRKMGHVTRLRPRS